MSPVSMSSLIFTHHLPPPPPPPPAPCPTLAPCPGLLPTLSGSGQVFACPPALLAVCMVPSIEGTFRLFMLRSVGQTS